MSRSAIVWIVGILVIAGGVGGYFVTRDGNDNDSSSQTSSSLNNNGQSSGDKSFAPVSTEGLAFAATITTSGEAGTNEAKIEYDGKEKTRYSATKDGQQSEIIYTADTYYFCASGSCIKYPISQSGASGFSPGDYQYDETELGNYKNNASYKGRQDCPAGTCDVWAVSNEGVISSIYIDTDTKRISQVEGSQNGTTTKIVYEYKDVSIEIPANAQEAPGI